MTSDHNIHEHTNAGRKRAATNNEVPPPKRHHPDAVDQLLETMKFQQQQIEKATDIWVRLKGGEDNMDDANTISLGLIKSAMYSGSLAVKLVESQDDDTAEQDKHLDKRFLNLESSIAEKQALALDILKNDMQEFACYEASDATSNLFSYSESMFREAFSDAVAQELDVTSREELREMTKFIRLQMKLSNDAPETSQDVLREHEVEIGL